MSDELVAQQELCGSSCKGKNVHKFQLSVLIVLRVDPANVGVGCANVLMANGFSNGSDARR
jgi:hypothetical protein